jgi:hypothetical protein
MQLDGLRDLAAQRGWLVPPKYVDVGGSGSKDRRPHERRRPGPRGEGGLAGEAPAFGPG